MTPNAYLSVMFTRTFRGVLMILPLGLGLLAARPASATLPSTGDAPVIEQNGPAPIDPEAPDPGLQPTDPEAPEPGLHPAEPPVQPAPGPQPAEPPAEPNPDENPTANEPKEPPPPPPEAIAGVDAQGMHLFGTLFADQPHESRWRVSLTGRYRLSAEQVSAMRADRFEHYDGDDGALTHRLELTPQVGVDYGKSQSFTVDADVLLASGVVAYDSTTPRGQASNGTARSYLQSRHAGAMAFTDYVDELRLRKLFLTWKTPVGLVMVGRMASAWGLGLQHNSGDDENQDWGGPRMGDDRNFGDVVDRALFATAPFALLSDAAWAKRWHLAVGADLVERDERTSREAGDIAVQGVGLLRYRDDDDHELGGLFAYRDLRDRAQDTLTAAVVDFYGRGRWQLWDIEVAAAGEIAWISGDTSEGRNNAFTSQVTIQQLGWVGRVGARYMPWDIGLDLELGYASGDSNPNDELLRGFSFDPSYNPSLILFGQVHAAQTRSAAQNASDPSRVGQAPENVRFLPTDGSVTNAVYLRPTLRYRYEGLAARFAFLWAVTEEANVDPFGANAYGGGGAVNFHGGDGNNRELGFELDLGVDYTFRFREWVELCASVQGGYFVPSNAFADAFGRLPQPVAMFFSRLMLRWLPPAQSAS
jgi:hypothetical protein